LSMHTSIIENNIVANGGFGIRAESSLSDSVIGNNISTNGYEGIELIGSSNNSIVGNTISHNNGGIRLGWVPSIGNNIIGNNITANNPPGEAGFGIGICCSTSSYTSIVGNNIANQSVGIDPSFGSHCNFVYQNNFVNNGQNAYMDVREPGVELYVNSWDNGANGGNYWSDHNCVGNPSNGDQNQWYSINDWNVDRYPFQNLINLEALRGALCIRVTDLSGNPIEGASVTASYYQLVSYFDLCDITDSAGYVYFNDITSGSYTLYVRADGYYPAVKTSVVTVGQSVSENIVLRASPQPYQCWAVIVGAAYYELSQIPPTPTCDFDAIAFYNRLYPIWGKDHIKLLLNEEATKQNIDAAITNWLPPLESQIDRVLIYFSGHGSTYAFQPYDYDITDSLLNNWLNVLDSQKVTVILDSCHSGGFIEKLSKSGRIIITACDANETAVGPLCFQHGLFTHFVLQSFVADGVDANMDGMISWQEIFSYAEPRVTARARLEAWPEQHPQVYYGFSEEPIITIAEFSRVLPLFLALLLTTALLVSAKSTHSRHDL